MKTLTTKLPESSQHDAQTDWNSVGTGEATWIRRGPLTTEELAEQKLRLDALAAMPDEDIDFSEIPAHTEEEIREWVHGPWTDRVERSLVLKIDDEVAAWLEENAGRKSYLINLLLKREAQRDKRSKALQGTGEMGKAS